MSDEKKGANVLKVIRLGLENRIFTAMKKERALQEIM